LVAHLLRFETITFMKRNYLLLFFALLSVGSYAQLTIQNGATFFIQPGATVTVQGDITSNANIQGTGILLLKGSALQTVNMNGFSIDPAVQIEISNNVALSGTAIINGSLAFTLGKVQLSNFDLTLAAAATISGFDNSKYFMTNGTGRLVKNSLGAVPFIYPVGFDGTTYNPLTVTQNGTVDNIGVRCLPSVLQNGSAGLPFVKEVVDASWAVSETVVGGSNLAMTSQWAGTDELPGFNSIKTGLSYYDGVGWAMTNLVTIAAGGAGPYTISRSNVTNLANGGIFAVGQRPVLTALLASPKVLLQGAHQSTPTPGLMRDDLRVVGQVPLVEPYAALPTASFVHSASGGGETIPSSVLATTGTGNDIVDWVFAELRRSSDGAVVATRSVLIERDGDVVDVDGTNTKVPYVNFAGETAGAGPYYVAIRHRNHVGVRTPGTLGLSRTVTTPWDFTTGAAQAMSSIQASLGSGLFGMYGGNANSNNSTRYTGGGAINDNAYLLNTVLGGVKGTIVTTYSLGDLNMNGSARYTGGGLLNDNAFLLNVVLGGVKGTIITQPF